MIKEINGNIIQLARNNNFDVIVHGCNCFNIMGAGLALQMAKEFPICLKEDKKTSYGDIYKLGTYSKAETLVRFTRKLTIINAYTQYRPGKDARYDAVHSSALLIHQHFYGKRIAFPAIGCGIGGLDKQVVLDILNKVFVGMNYVYLVNYKEDTKEVPNETEEASEIDTISFD